MVGGGGGGLVGCVMGFLRGGRAPLVELVTQNVVPVGAS